MAREAKITPLGLAIMELLHEHPMHPYEMQQTMRHRHTDRTVKLKAGSLYHAVERLEKLGLIEVAETSREGRRPERTLYRMTDLGRERFAEEVPELVATVAEEFPAFPLGLALGDDLGPDALLAALRERERELARLVELDGFAIAQIQQIELPPRYWLDVRYSLTMRSTELAFVRELIQDIESGRVNWTDEEKHP